MVSQITQSVYDGLILLHWATGKVFLLQIELLNID